MEKRCYICGSSRHLQSVCPRRHSVPVATDVDEYDYLCNDFAGRCAVQPPSGVRQAGRPRYQARNADNDSSSTHATKFPSGRGSSHAPTRGSVKSFCGVCGKYGHLARDCWFREEESPARQGWYPAECDLRRPGSNRREFKHRDESKRYSGKHADGSMAVPLNNDAVTRSSRRRKLDDETPFSRDYESSHARDRQWQRDRDSHVEKYGSAPSEQGFLKEQTDKAIARSEDTNVAGEGVTSDNGGLRGANDADRGSDHDGSRRKATERRLTLMNKKEDAGGLHSGAASVFLEDECSYDEYLASSGRRRPRRRPPLSQGQPRQDTVTSNDQYGREEGYPGEAAAHSGPVNQSARRDVLRRAGRKPQPTGVGARERAHANFRLFNETVVVCYNCGRSGHKSFDCPESGLNRAKSSK